MDQETLDLIARLNDPEQANPLTAAEVAHLRSTVGGIMADVDVSNPDDTDLAVLAEGRGVLDRLDEVETAANADLADRQARAAALLDGANLGTAEGDDGGDGPEGEPAPDPAAGEGAAEGEPAPGQAADAPAPEGTASAEDALPIAAAGTPAGEPAPRPALPSISNLRERSPRMRRQAEAARNTGARPHATTLLASGDLPGLGSGEEVDVERWAWSVAQKWDALRRLEASGQQFLRFGKVTHDYDPEMVLDRDDRGNERKLRDNLAEDERMLASGGICGPVAADYGLSTIAVADRPVRDGLVQRGADRGGVRFILPHTLAAVTGDGPSGVWTQATDAAPGGTTKAQATYVCQTPSEVYVDAVTSIVKFGNFQARYFPEQVDQYMQTVDAVHSRLAEATLLAAITTGSTATTGDSDILGAVSDLLGAWERAAEAYRYRHRMGKTATLQLMFPEYVWGMMRSDLARELPGSAMERFAYADAQLAEFFAVRNLAVTTFMDSPTGAAVLQGFVVQGPGMLVPWPSKVISYMFHPGAWVFLDGGELNIGMVRDSTLNRTNDFQMFSETFEKAVFRGHESLQITLDVCPSGLRAGSVDTSGLCRSGS